MYLGSKQIQIEIQIEYNKCVKFKNNICSVNIYTKKDHNTRSFLRSEKTGKSIIVAKNLAHRRFDCLGESIIYRQFIIKELLAEAFSLEK